MNATKPKINILLVGTSGVGKTSLCQAFGANFVDGFSYGVGLSKRARVVELVTEKCIYHVIDAPNVYDSKDETITQRHAVEINRTLNLSTAPYVVCFVINIQKHDMRAKQSDLLMMKTIKHYYNQGQVKFSLIINRLTEKEFDVFSRHAQYRKEFLDSFGRDAGVPITDDDILLIHDKFPTYSLQEQKELLTSYVRKFESGHMSEFDNFMLGYNAYTQKYQNDLNRILGQNNSSYQSSYLHMIQQAQHQQQQNQMKILQQMMGGGTNNMFSSASTFVGSSYQRPQQQQSNPYSHFMPGGGANAYQQPTSPTTSSPNDLLSQYLQSAGNDNSSTDNLYNQYIQIAGGGNSATNDYLSQYMAANGISFNSPQTLSSNSTANDVFGSSGSFMGGYNQQTQSPQSSYNTASDIFGAAGAFMNGYNQQPQSPQPGGNTTNDFLGAAGAFVGGAMGNPGVGTGSNNDMYGAAGQFVGGAVTAGCSIM